MFTSSTLFASPEDANASTPDHAGMSTHMPPSSPLLSLRRAVAERIVSASYMRKWLVLGVLIGAVAGLGAVVFVHTLELATHFFLGVIGGYAPPIRPRRKCGARPR